MGRESRSSFRIGTLRLARHRLDCFRVGKA